MLLTMHQWGRYSTQNAQWSYPEVILLFIDHNYANRPSQIFQIWTFFLGSFKYGRFLVFQYILKGEKTSIFHTT